MNEGIKFHLKKLKISSTLSCDDPFDSFNIVVLARYVMLSNDRWNSTLFNMRSFGDDERLLWVQEILAAAQTSFIPVDYS